MRQVDTFGAQSPHVFAPLLHRARDFPNDVFCHFFKFGDHKTYTYGDVAAAAVSFADRLVAQGVGIGQIVPIMLEHRIELYSSFIGTALAGAVPTFLPPLTVKQDPRIFTHSLEQLLARLQPGCVVGSAHSFAPLDLRLDVPQLDIDEPLPAAPGRENGAGARIAASTADDVVLLQHSSGTTGLKKGVMLTHRMVRDQVDHYAKAIAITDRDVIASWLPLYHDMGLITAFLVPATLGLPLISIDAMEWVLRPTILLDAIEAFGGTLCWLPNFAFHHLVRLADPQRQWDLSTLRMIVSCSEPCRAKAFDDFADRFAASGIGPEMLQVSYAMAENVFAVTQTEPTRPVRRSPRPEYAGFLSSGRPIEGVELKIVAPDASPELVPAEDGFGEIAIHSDCLFGGYFKQPDLTAAKLRNGWYRSGDLGFLSDGELFVTGRVDDVLNINGKKIFAHEVEDSINMIEGVAPGRVLAYAEFENETETNHMIVVAERTTDMAENDRDIAARIRQIVFATCGVRPQFVGLLQKGFLLKSTSGKISRRASVEKIRDAKLFGEMR